jgi:gamma-glutamylcyclotransferase (GGCT)/AIG2-like uncharacterized protein YtfP
VSTLLFVYGTLKRGCCNHRLLAGQSFLGVARTVPGYSLRNLGGYPGIFPDPADRAGVAGEIWSIAPDALARLDAFEGVPEGLFRRAAIPLLAPFAAQPIETYLPSAPASGHRVVGTDWTESSEVSA